MTHNSSIFKGPKIALFEPDIPQNTAAIIRTCACLGAELEIIEPCGFLLSDKRFKRVVMDYMNSDEIEVYESSDHFFKSKEKKPIMLENLRNIFYRMELSTKETRILSGVFASLGKKR